MNNQTLVPTQREIVQQTIEKTPKSIKEIADDTKILEPNIRRILGIGAKEGFFERIDRGVYILSRKGEDIAYVHTADAVETLPKLAEQGIKVDMVFLDPPYTTPAVKGGNRPQRYDVISPEEFGRVMRAISRLIKDDDTPVYYIASKAPSGLKEMACYTQQIFNAGFKIVAQGEYTKLQKDKISLATNPQGKSITPEALILFTKSGKFIEKEIPRNLTFRLVRPAIAGKEGYPTQKPAEMLESIIKQGTFPDDMLLDPFAGSGTAPAKAIELKRRVIAIEKSFDAVERFIKPRIKTALNPIKTQMAFGFANV